MTYHLSFCHHSAVTAVAAAFPLVVLVEGEADETERILHLCAGTLRVLTSLCIANNHTTTGTGSISRHLHEYLFFVTLL